MNAPARKGGMGIWIAAGLGACCVLPGVGLAGLFFLGMLGALMESPGGSSTSSASAPTSAVVANAADDDFLYKAPNGLSYIAENRVAAEGVNVTLAGEWREEHRNIVLRLRETGSYELSESGAVVFTHRDSGAFSHADSSSSAERGTWTFSEGVLTLTPQRRDLSATSGIQNLGTSSETADTARAWNVSGVTIEYTPHDGTPRQRPGIHVVGPSPNWTYPTGTWDLVLRSAPWSG